MGPLHARGFSLLETVIAVAIAVLIGWLLVFVLAHLLRAGRLQSARDLEQRTIVQLSDAIATEEDDAWAIYVPPSDVLGKPNSDGHEVDFFTRDGKQQPYFWAYNYDASAQTVRRYRFASPGGAATLDVEYAGIVRFSAHTYRVTALQDANTPIYSALYDGAALQSGIVRFYPGLPWIAGGNNITYVQFAGATMRRDLELVTQTAPSGFTVVLNYTPSPSPTPSSAPKVWPAAIVFAAPGMTLASAPQQPVNVAMMLNRLLGGGIALAQRAGCGLDCPKPSPQPTLQFTPTPAPTFSATPQPATPTQQPATPSPVPATPAPSSGACTAVAYADAAMTQRLPPGTVNPYTGQVVIDSNGCYGAGGNSASYTVHEDQYIGGFIDGPNSCGAHLFPGGWSQPDGTLAPNGPTSSQVFTASTATNGTCSLTFVDSSSQHVTAQAAVMFPNPLYALVNSTDTVWTYDCLDKTPQGVCINGGWQGSTTNSSIEYASTNQGTTWTQMATCSSSTNCPDAPQFTDTETSCTQDKAGGPCGSANYKSNRWSPYAPPNAP
ncbi:MAG TPA: hypothetical protein VJP85_15490 [Candidatus Baltobacteraceae bacterium]|nr:hypothetical protein [Candidatus Baltobacteraceae bacterium]